MVTGREITEFPGFRDAQNQCRKPNFLTRDSEQTSCKNNGLDSLLPYGKPERVSEIQFFGRGFRNLIIFRNFTTWVRKHVRFYNQVKLASIKYSTTHHYLLFSSTGIPARHQCVPQMCVQLVWRHPDTRGIANSPRVLTVVQPLSPYLDQMARNQT